MTKDLVHSVLVSFCSTDVCRPLLREPMMLHGNVYATDGRLSVRFSHQIGFNYPMSDKQFEMCKSIDSVLSIDGQYHPVCFSHNSLLSASMLATADALQVADFEPENDGFEYWREDVESHALVKIENLLFRAVYIKKIIDVLMVFDWVSAKCYLFNKGLVFIADDVAFVLMCVRDVSYQPDGCSIVDGSTCKFIHHESDWID